MAVILLLIPISEKLMALSVKNNGNLLLSASAVQLFIFAVPTAFYCKINELGFPEHSKARRLHWIDLPFTVASAFTCFFAAIMLMYLQLNLFPDLSGVSSSPMQTYSETDPLGVLLAYVIVPAFAEEFFFRGIILSEYSGFKGPYAITVSAVFFAMLHFSFVQFPIYFVIGVILATITYVTNTSFPSAIIHLIYNATIVYGGEGLSKFLKESSSSVILAFLLTVALMISTASMLSSMETVYVVRSELFNQGKLPGSRLAAVNKIAKAGKVEKREEKPLNKTVSVFLSPTFFLCILIFVLITVDII